MLGGLKGLNVAKLRHEILAHQELKYPQNKTGKKISVGKVSSAKAPC
jgi:hypothetical protein